jgi:hypothetical protein
LPLYDISTIESKLEFKMKFNKNCKSGDTVVIIRHIIFPEYNGNIGFLKFNYDCWTVEIPRPNGLVYTLFLIRTADKIRKCRSKIPKYLYMNQLN